MDCEYWKRIVSTDEIAGLLSRLVSTKHGLWVLNTDEIATSTIFPTKWSLCCAAIKYWMLHVQIKQHELGEIPARQVIL
jgi:hypothetical protein